MVKCHQYWPLGNEHDGEEEMILKEVNLKVSIHGEKEATDYIIRELLLTNLESYESRTVLHFHYTTWPDFGVPESPSAFLSFLLAVRDSGALNQNVGPVVVHCSAGIGRSGTFCLVDSCLVLIEERGNLDAVNVQEILLEMRKYRMGLIQTPDQLRFSYLAIIEGAKQVLARRKNISENVLSDHHQNSLDGQHEDEQVNTVSSNEPKGVKRKTEFLKKEVVKEVSESKINQGVSENDWDETEPLPLIPQNKPSSDTLEERKLSYISERTVSSLTSLDTANQEPKNTEFAEEDETITNNTVSIANLSSATEKNVNDSEIRKRKRKERIDKTAETVQKMRQKLQDSESWERHKLLLKKCSIGAVLLLGMGYLVYRYYVQG
ncbi:tyrosine-protein phosphatase non-receptor type 1-like isoform X2 [Limulus polyphemus]|uniref:protein-tyrosine-phosphatase n=1 Tax=Limulus polyphemus TaxID=6850 RepID=A0ABM1T666_LIMPO|nr:tyrosine-protein phosphatase non-receptor type 1-like isoform X2 [Limulus polyphemus]